jgi:hypothetical protein
MKKTYSDKDLAELIGLVETQFADHLKKAETDLTKTETVIVPEVTPVPTVVVAPAAVVVPVEVKKNEFTYTEEDFKEMDTLYKSMNKDEAEAHYKSLKKAIFGDVQETEIKKSEALDLAKSENDLLKSEVAKITKEKEDLQKNFDKATEVLGKIVKTVPQRKAITEIQFVNKTDTDKKDATKLNKRDVADKLSTQISSGKLEKKDLDAISDYYNKPNGSIELIKHLL